MSGFTLLEALAVSAKCESENVKKCIRMGLIVLKLSFWEVNRRFYGRKIAFHGSAGVSP